MPVYVDKAKNRSGRMIMSHMMADTLEELHYMANRVGLKREWFQNNGTPHYDLCQSKRALAIRLGAIEVDRKKVVKIIKFWREKRQGHITTQHTTDRALPGENAASKAKSVNNPAASQANTPGC